MTDLVEALNLHGLKFLEAKQYTRAEDFFREAIRRDPDRADAHTNLGVVLFLQFKYEEAISILARADAIRPDQPETLLNYGYSLWRMNRVADARQLFERAIAVNDMPQAHIALGSLCWQQADIEGAVRHCRIGLEYEPDNLMAHDTLREVAHHCGSETDALAQCDVMTKLFSDVSHRYKRSLVMLTYGNQTGWAEQECRYEASKSSFMRSAYEKPHWFCKLFDRKWDGRPTEHLLVSTEQGFGDVIQFLRFLPLVRQLCTKLSVYLPPALCHIARRSFPGIDFYAEIPEDFDHYCLIMSLAYLLGRTEDIPSPPYLVAPKECYGEVRRLAGLKVGLVWAGIGNHRDDRWRSIPFDKVTKLFEVPITFVSLQFPCTEDLSSYPILDVHPVPSVPLGDGSVVIDWSETAALIDALDLVIAADTAVAHMAGALNKPVWMLNRYNTDWRWMLDRTDTPWYPSMTIFRQPRLDDWDSVITNVVNALRQFAAPLP